MTLVWRQELLSDTDHRHQMRRLIHARSMLQYYPTTKVTPEPRHINPSHLVSASLSQLAKPEDAKQISFFPIVRRIARLILPQLELSRKIFVHRCIKV